MSRLVLHDNKWIQFSEYTEELDIFHIAHRIETRPYELFGAEARAHMSLVFEHDLDLRVVERETGTYFDWISSAGGLNKGLRLIFSLVVSFLNYNVYSVYMVSHLYSNYKTCGIRKTPSSDIVDDNMNEANKSIDFNPDKMTPMMMLFFAVIPDSCRKRFNESKCCTKRT